MKKTYKIEDNTKNNLFKLGFRHIGDGVFEKRFVGYKWQGYTTIYCKMIAFDDSKDIVIDVYRENNDLYAPYYTNDDNNEVLKIVRRNINNELKKCNIYE